MIGFYLILIWGIFACQMFFPTIRLIALSFLQEIILIWEIFADIWYFFFLFVLDLSADIFVLSFVSAFVFLMYSVNVFWVSSQTESQICLQELFWCFPDQSVIFLLYLSARMICSIHCVCQYLSNENSASVWLDWALWRHCLSGELSRCLPLSIS